jgi:hypothetical protein
VATEKLDVIPMALRAASGAIAGHSARVASGAGSLSESAEMSGVAAAALHSAFDEYCAEFSNRLSSVSAALVRAAGSFTEMEGINSQSFLSIVPVRQV